MADVEEKGKVYLNNQLDANFFFYTRDVDAEPHCKLPAICLYLVFHLTYYVISGVSPDVLYYIWCFT